MTRRALISYTLVMLLLTVSILGTASAFIGGETYTEVVGQQSMYALHVASSRGTIYDRNLVPLTNTVQQKIAAVVPDVDSMGRLYAATNGEKREELRVALESGKPFLVEVETPVSDENIETFVVSKRYEDVQPAANLIGYLENGKGADGIEYCFEDVLSEGQGNIDVYFAIDAVGGAISGEGMLVENTYRSEKSGVVLTLDREIQMAVEAACAEIGKGAAVVLDTQTGGVLAMASFPPIDPNDLAAEMNDENAPFLNRALCGYAPGSVFKLVGAAAALENGYDFRETYTCTGSTLVSGMEFACYEGIAHGEVNMHTALRKSCNGYFIHLAEKLGAGAILKMAESVGFGKSLELAPALYTDESVLSSEHELMNPRARANFAFGQGETLISPVQLAGAVNAIASGGEYRPPFVILGVTDENGEITDNALPEYSTAMQRTTANRLMAYMESTARYGTARAGAPRNGKSGIKTGTAQTGVFTEEGEEILNFWYAGYQYGKENVPGFTVVLLEETAGESHTAAAFRKICEFLADSI